MGFNFASEIIFKQFQDSACYASLEVSAETSKAVWPAVRHLPHGHRAGWDRAKVTPTSLSSHALWNETI